MFIAILGFQLLEGLFLLGMAGSTVVALINFFHDSRLLIGRE
jgi:hypothetical protein